MSEEKKLDEKALEEVSGGEQGATDFNTALGEFQKANCVYCAQEDWNCRHIIDIIISKDVPAKCSFITPM